jgi:hypothetical protein
MIALPATGTDVVDGIGDECKEVDVCINVAGGC